MEITSIRFKKEMGNDTYISGRISLNDENVPYVEFDSDISCMSIDVLEEYLNCLEEAKDLLGSR